MPSRARSLFHQSFLGAGDSQTRPRGENDSPSVREAVRQAEQDRQRRCAQIRDFDDRIDHLHDRLIAWHRANEVSSRLATIPGIGPVTASLISAYVSDAAQY